jgi:protease-4
MLRRLLPGRWRAFPDHRVAVVRLYGPIMGGGRTTDWIELLQRVRESKRVPAVVIDIDSPGGSATASDDLFLAVERLDAVKPVVAAIRGIGASGSYLAAVGARRILANPNAVVGSIGVISASPHLPRLLERVGVTVSETKAGRLKGAGSPWRDDSDEELAKERQLIDAIYDAFVGRVAKARGLSTTRVRELATGEVWLGTEALALGLVDEIGDTERAIEVAAELAGVPPRGAPVRIRRPFMIRLVDRFADRTAAAIGDEVALRIWDRWRLG